MITLISLSTWGLGLILVFYLMFVYSVFQKDEFRQYVDNLRNLDFFMSLPISKQISRKIEKLSVKTAKYERKTFQALKTTPEQVLNHLVQESPKMSHEVAREIGISPLLLADYRSGRKKLSSSCIEKCASYFNVSPSTFGSENLRS